jgi:hypothetical protein
MKPRYFILSIIVVVLSACDNGNSPTDKDAYISFSTPFVFDTQLDYATRSTFINGSLPNNSSFGVLGYCIPYIVGTIEPDAAGGNAEWSKKIYNSYPDVFNQVAVTISADGDSCSYSNSKKWYDSEGVVDASQHQYTFFAYYPKNSWSVGNIGNGNKGAPTFTYTIPDGADDSEILDVMLATRYNHKRADGAVMFNFSHMLSGFGVKVSNYNQNSEIIIKSLTLTGTFNHRLTIDFAKTGNDMYEVRDASAETYTFVSTTDTDITLNPNDVVDNIGGKHILLLPDIKNSSLGNGMKLVVDYVFNDEPKTANIEVKDFNALPGVDYTFSLLFAGDTFILEIVASNGELWDNGDDETGNNSTIM